MRKVIFLAALSIILLISFSGGFFFATRNNTGIDHTAQGREILYYVDPMNPAHTTTKPGPAPCGMPMEPVYADNNSDSLNAMNGTMNGTPAR
jgi:Cu(I)/Ag(I) efflux system membrane fusion protein